jgi:hypothetical protein
MNYQILIILSLLIISCSPIIKSNLGEYKFAQLNNDIPIHIVELDKVIPKNSKFIGKLKIGDNYTGLVANCEYDEIILIAKEESRKLGANIIKLVKIKEPDYFTSSCYRIEAELYRNFNKIFLNRSYIPITAFGEEKTILDNLQGIHQGAFTFINGNGYQITKFVYEKEFNSKTIKKLKKKFKIDSNLSGQKKEEITHENLMFDSNEHLANGVINKRKIFIISGSEKNTILIEFNNILESDNKFEDVLLNRILLDEIPPNILMPMNIDSFRFGNRFIKLGPICNWKEVRNIQCDRMGQMDWSEFRNEKRAKQYIEQRIKITNEIKLSEFSKQEIVPVQFEGVETTAKKYTLKVKLPKFVLGGSNTLFIYYITCKVGKRYISCILSHYDNDINGPNLPPLLSEVLILK